MSRRFISRAKQEPMDAMGVDGQIVKRPPSGAGKLPSTGGFSKEPGQTCHFWKRWTGGVFLRAMLPFQSTSKTDLNDLRSQGVFGAWDSFVADPAAAGKSLTGLSRQKKSHLGLTIKPARRFNPTSFFERRKPFLRVAICHSERGCCRVFSL